MSLLVRLLPFCAWLFALAGYAAEAGRPNIVVVLADQWRAQAFGFAGDPNVKTPNFDRLAGESVRFTNAVAGMPVCSPTAGVAAHRAARIAKHAPERERSATGDGTKSAILELTN